MGTLLALALASAHYSFEPGKKHDYQMTAVFDGFLPILGGNTGKAEISMGIVVTGESSSGQEVKAASEISSFSMKFNEAPLPFGIEMVQDFFPKAVVTLTPQGKIISNTAPDKDLPVKLPGLDPKRMPDITFVPLEFPEKELSAGDVWKFEKAFSGAPIAYSCRVEKIENSVAEISVSVKQVLSFLESDSIEVVKKEEDAASSVKTEMLGTGRVWFDLGSGVPLGSKMKNTAVSRVTPLKQGKPSERKMITTLEVVKKGFELPKVVETSPKTGAPVGQPPKLAAKDQGLKEMAQAALSSAWKWASEGAQAAAGSLTKIKVLAQILLVQAPHLGPEFIQTLVKSWLGLGPSSLRVI